MAMASENDKQPRFMLDDNHNIELELTCRQRITLREAVLIRAFKLYLDIGSYETGRSDLLGTEVTESSLRLEADLLDSLSRALSSTGREPKSYIVSESANHIFL